MTLQIAEYKDAKGRLWRRGLPEGVPVSQASLGVPLGPPALDDLELPEKVRIRLHNELYARGIFTDRDARSRITEVRAALSAALRVDVHRILAIYEGQGAEQ